MKQNIISLIFGIISLSFGLSSIVTTLYLQRFSGAMSTYQYYDINNSEVLNQALQTTSTATSIVLAIFGIGCGLVALLVGRNGVQGSKMRSSGMIMGGIGLALTVVGLLIAIF